MSVKRQQIPITSPCPITLDRSGVDPNDRELFCANCSKDVHLLSHMTEREARELMSRRAGEDICVSYIVRSDGRIRFRPEPPLVPPTSLVRPTLRRGLSMAASIGAAAFIAACTPHGEAEIQGSETEKTEPAQVERQPVEAPPPELVAGGITADPVPPEPCDPEELAVDGGIKAARIDPPDPIPEAKPVHRAGGLRARPLEPTQAEPLGLEQKP